MTYETSIKQQEQKAIYFTITQDGATFDLTGAMLTLIVQDTNGSAVITKNTADFDTTDIATGRFNVLLTDTDLNLTPGRYKAELKIELTPLVDKSTEFYIRIDEAIT